MYLFEPSLHVFIWTLTTCIYSFPDLSVKEVSDQFQILAQFTYRKWGWVGPWAFLDVIHGSHDTSNCRDLYL